MKTLVLAAMLLTTPALAATPTPPGALSSHDVYRLDFELTTTQPGKPATTIAFSLNLEEHRRGEVSVGENVPLAGSGGAAGAPQRQNVGTHVMAEFELVGADLLLEVDTELSELIDPARMTRISAKDVALASPGHKTMVASIDHDKTRTLLTVTPVKL
jgi:hypothetical protein